MADRSWINGLMYINVRSQVIIIVTTTSSNMRGGLIIDLYIRNLKYIDL